jgi:hypothetical protein
MGGQKLGGVRHPSGVIREDPRRARRIMLGKKKCPALSQQRVLAEEEIGPNYLEPYLESRPNSMCALCDHMGLKFEEKVS